MHRQPFWIRRVYAGLLCLYPASHRQTFADEMTTVFAEALADAAARGWLSVVALCLRELRDLPQLLFGEYRLAIMERAQGRLFEQAQPLSEPPGFLPTAPGSVLSILHLIIGYDPRVRRLFDVAFALVCILIATPLWLALPLFIKCDSRGPIIYRQMRLGKDGRPYTMFKFRSMHAYRPSLLPQSVINYPASDPRLTRVGRLTRQYHLDEIPQLFNVLKGDMSVLGPRPQGSAQ